jgi:hypothetical protein
MSCVINPLGKTPPYGICDPSYCADPISGQPLTKQECLPLPEGDIPTDNGQPNGTPCCKWAGGPGPTPEPSACNSQTTSLTKSCMNNTTCSAALVKCFKGMDDGKSSADVCSSYKNWCNNQKDTKWCNGTIRKHPWGGCVSNVCDISTIVNLLDADGNYNLSCSGGDDSGLSTGAIIGIVIGALVVIAIIIFIVLRKGKKKKKKK